MGDFLSLFSGIGGLDLGLERAGWRCVGQVESDPYRRAVLERWWPGVPRADDVRSFDPAAWPALRGAGRRTMGAVEPSPAADRALSHGAGVDLISGGFPCQDLSVAGKRAGLEGPRSSLWWEFHRIIAAVRPRWVLVENVPGLLSSHKGRDFALLLASLAELGYGVAWRVLDSRYFGVPQRRRRVFVVGHLGVRGPEPFRAFLEGGGGHPAARRATGPEATGVLGSGSSSRRFNFDGAYIPMTAHALKAKGNMDHREDSDNIVLAHSLRSNERNTSQGPGNYIAAPLSHGSNPNSNAAGRRREDDENLIAATVTTSFAKGNANDGAHLTPGAVRRLTPVECCRLQGFPDHWLGGNEPPDSPKYAALGDAVTVPVAEWIGRRLAEGALNTYSEHP